MTAYTVRVVTPSGRLLPEGLGVAEWHSALEHAASLWSYPQISCSHLELRVAPPAHLRSAAEDGRNVVVFRGERWCHDERCARERVFPKAAAGMTTTYPDGSRGAQIVEADIELNAVGFSYDGGALVSSATGARVPLGTVLVHELGHAVGLEDSCNGKHDHEGLQGPSDPDGSVMCAPARLPAPTQGDVRKVCELYPRVLESEGQASRLPANEATGSTGERESIASATGGASWAYALAVAAVIGAIVLAAVLFRGSGWIAGLGRVVGRARSRMS
jgi:hypothetical protein